MKITLRAARINSNFTIKQVASRMGVSEEVFRNYERGRTNIPMDKLEALLTLYEVDAKDIKEVKE